MKSLVAIFAGFLILYSAYQLSFTWFVNKHEGAMADKAKQWVKANFGASTAKYPESRDLQTLYEDSLENYKNERLRRLLDSTRDKKITWWGDTYQKSKEKELLLGLDLQGGINVTMDIQLDGLIKDGLSNNPNDLALKNAVAEANRRKLNSGGVDYISLFANVYKSQNPGKSLAPLFSNNVRNKLKIDASDAEVITYIRGQAKAAMIQTKNILSKRIDKFGVSQPNLSLDENKNIITVELAGAKDPERVKKFLQSSANLQFWEVYTINELGGAAQAADKALEDYLNGKKADTSNIAVATTDTTKEKSLNEIINSKDTAKNSQAKVDANKNLLLSAFYPAFQAAQQKDGGVPDYVGLVPIADTGKIGEYLSLPIVRSSFPVNVKFLWGKQDIDDNGKAVNYLKLYALQTVPGQDKAKIEGDAIIDARQDFASDQSGKVTVDMSMNKQGATAWAKMTKENVGRPLAIVLDDIVYSAPTVNGEITGGNSQITMGGGGKNTNLIVAEAQDLEAILKSGKLNAPAKIVQSQEVGASLSAEALKGGAWAFIISFAVIFTLMLVYYNTAGWVANIALILNLLFTVGVLSSLGATLTAPGIAGLVLTIGMAVDTNVIIFERIKEELTRGKSYQQAVSDGYRRSLPPVLDAHVTTLLTACILLYFGLGPVKGFATTQIIGILLSLFCGILVSRIITDFWTNKQRHFNYFTGLSKRVFKHAAYKFIEYRKVAYGISVVVLLLGIGALLNGFKYGVEFQGGRSFIVNFYKPVNTDEVRRDINAVLGGEASVKTYGSNSKLDIVTDYKINDKSDGVEASVRAKLFESLKKHLPANATAAEFATTKKFIEGSNSVDPTISDDLKTGAQWATFWSLLIITFYIFIRFRDWRYSLGTIVALLHDVLVTLAVFSFFKNIVPFPLEIDQHFIAAVLTVIGFSMNDTVIVFDRVREYSRTMKGASKAEIINKAINDTLSRTIMTSLTVFLTILILFLVGGEVTKGFAFAMLIGVITGTYSSIFVAAPILVDFAKSKPLGEADLLPHQQDAAKKTTTATTTAGKTVTAKS
jgi:SecD/SecF fusion protein